MSQYKNKTGRTWTRLKPLFRNEFAIRTEDEELMNYMKPEKTSRVYLNPMQKMSLIMKDIYEYYTKKP